MRLLKVKVLIPGEAQSEAVQGTTYEELKAGIQELTELANGDVLVKGDRSTFRLKAANIAWVQPASDPSPVALSEAAPLRDDLAGPRGTSDGKEGK